MMTQGTAEPHGGGDTEAEIADWKRAHTELVRLAALRARSTGTKAARCFQRCVSGRT